MEYASYKNKLDASVVSVEQDKDKKNWALKATNKLRCSQLRGGGQSKENQKRPEMEVTGMVSRNASQECVLSAVNATEKAKTNTGNLSRVAVIKAWLECGPEGGRGKHAEKNQCFSNSLRPN